MFDFIFSVYFSNVLTQKQKLEQKLQETSASATANSMPSNHLYGEFLPATPKNTPFFMTPPLTPPNESMGFLSMPPPPGGWDYGDMFGYGVLQGLEKGKGSTPKGKTKVGLGGINLYSPFAVLIL